MNYATAFEAFGRWCLEELRGDNLGNDIDGYAAQEKAKALGLLVVVSVTEPCGENCSCVEWDDFPQTCLREATPAPGDAP